MITVTGQDITIVMLVGMFLGTWIGYTLARLVDVFMEGKTK